jgi:hypothetical protein
MSRLIYIHIYMYCKTLLTAFYNAGIPCDMHYHRITIIMLNAATGLRGSTARGSAVNSGAFFA